MPVLPLFGRILIRIMHNDAGKCILRGSDIRLLEKSLPNEAGKMLGKRIEMSHLRFFELFAILRGLQSYSELVFWANRIVQREAGAVINSDIRQNGIFF